MENQFWRWFAIAFCGVNTLCVIMLIEFFIYGIPYFTLFILIFSLTLFLNRHNFKKAKDKSAAQATTVPADAVTAINPS